MKTLLKLLSLLACIASEAQSQVPTYTILHPKQNYVVPKDGAVVLSIGSFAEYHYIAKQYDTLKKEVAELQNVVGLQDIINQCVIRNYDLLIQVKDSSIVQYKVANENLVAIGQQCGIEKKQLIVDYIKLEQKNKRVKRWRNFFIGTTATAFTTIAIIIRH
jgi:hypothetical protein